MDAGAAHDERGVSRYERMTGGSEMPPLRPNRWAGQALRAEEIEYFSETARRVGATLLPGNGNVPAPTAAADSGPSTDAQLEGCEIAGQECEPEQREVNPCFDR